VNLEPVASCIRDRMDACETLGEQVALLHVKWWQERGFPEGVPDESPYELEAARKAPSWRRVCKSLLRNDYWGKGLGFSQHKSDAYKAYLDLMRRRRDKWGLAAGAVELPFELAEVAG